MGAVIIDHVYTEGHPEANGRKPRHGEHEYTLIFPLQGGNKLHVHCGDADLLAFSDMIGRLLIDNADEIPEDPPKPRPEG